MHRLTRTPHWRPTTPFTSAPLRASPRRAALLAARSITALSLSTLALFALTASAHAASSPFASRVVAFDPAPGQFVQNPLFNDPARALGAPIGGGVLSPDNAKLVSLGGFGGSLTLAFDSTIPNLPLSARNPLGLDAIVFGNAIFVAGLADFRFAECATVEIAQANALGQPTKWYLIPGSNLAPPFTRTTKSYSAAALPPTWVPATRLTQSSWSVSTFQLPAATFSPPLLADPSNTIILGYADFSPTLVLGDLNADGLSDEPNPDPAAFYTKPSDPFTLAPTAALAGIPGVGAGGDAFDIDWAIDPDTGLPPITPLTGFDFIRITTAVDRVSPALGEVSTEIGAVARVVLPPPARPADIADNASIPGPDGEVDNGDFSLFISQFFNAATQLACTGTAIPCAAADIADNASNPSPDGFLDNGDFSLFIADFFAGGAP